MRRVSILAITAATLISLMPGAAQAADPALASVTVTPDRVIGGTPSTGRVTLVSSAPAGGVVVPLMSDHTPAATVPPSVTVPAGATSATFTITTFVVPGAQSALIIGTAGGVTKYGIITVTTEASFNRGSISLARGGNGGGRVTSQPAGIDCTLIAGGGTTGTCGNVFFPAGTQIRLDARPASGSRFQGWDFEVSCRDAPNVTIVAEVAHICRPVFRLR